MTIKHSRARHIMAASGGLISRSQLLDAGMSPLDIKHLVRAGQLAIVRRGIYVDGELWQEADERHERHRIRTRAAIRLMNRGFVVSHDSSAHEHGMDILLPKDPHVHITRPGFTSAWTQSGVKHHLAGFVDEQVIEVNGLPVFDLARTAVDIAREHEEPFGLAACDSALRLGVPKQALYDAVAPMRNWPHVKRARSAVDLSDPGAQTIAESLGRDLVLDLGIGLKIETQFPVQLDDGRVVWLDIVVGCHAFEVDGKIKYTPVGEGGVAERPIQEVVWAEKKRERDLHGQRLGTSRIIWEDYWPGQRPAALRRLRAEYDDTTARFGDQLPERLVRNAREIRSQTKPPGQRSA